MHVGNIDRLLVFREDAEGRALTLAEIRARCSMDAAGTNCYYGVNQRNVTAAGDTGSALQPPHLATLEDLLGVLQRSQDDEKMLMLGLEPPDDSDPHKDDPYAYVNAHMDLIQRLAAELAAFQQRAWDIGKRLIVVVRYASEMNDPGQAQGRNPDAFKSTFARVRAAFRTSAPDVLLAFSPALRADLSEQDIQQYWPGDDCVDIVSGTWYVGSPEQHPASHANMKSYFLSRIGLGKGFGLDEIGGCDANGRNNDIALQRMLNDIESLQMQNVTLRYATLFLAGKWGTDATLGFLS